MVRLMPRRGKKVGLAPGTVVFTGERKLEHARIRLIDYDEEGLREQELDAIDEALPFKDLPTVTWINVDGLHDTDLMHSIGEHFGLHSLVLEDIVGAGQRAKLEEHDGHLYLVLRMLSVGTDGEPLQDEQLSLVIGSNFVFTFQERVGDFFEPVRERIRSGKSRIRRMGPDYLAYALADVIVDRYFNVLEHLGDRIEAMEEEVIERHDPETIQVIHQLRRDALHVRRAVWPLREAISGIMRSESELIGDTLHPYLRDVHDHAVQVVDTVEVLRELVSGVMDLYLTGVSNRMNDTMKVLTIIATIFIPLSFIAGVYGMNFEWIPELSWRWGYFGALGLMAGVAVGLLTLFRRRRWI